MTPERLAQIRERWEAIKACNEPGLFDSWEDEPEGWMDELLAVAGRLAAAEGALREIAREDQLVRANEDAFSVHALRRCQGIASAYFARVESGEER